MTRPSFDVLTEPWIPVITAEGGENELGLLPCLEQAHELLEIKDPAPIVEFGLYRLLVAFVLDALIWADERPRDHYDLEDLLEKGSFDASLLRDYAQACGDVFDLFHPQRPFLQTAMEEAEGVKPLADMFPVIPAGISAIHWHHQLEDGWEVGPAYAARLLATIAPFMTAGGRGMSPSINGAPGVYVLPVGRNLYETLVLNLPLRHEQEAGDGAVAWRQKRAPGGERVEATTAEALTWRPRRIQLLPEVGEDEQGRPFVRVGRMRFAQGDSTRFTWIDANLAYRYEASKVTPVRMRENRSLWRDAGPLLLLNDLRHGSADARVLYKRPDVIENAFQLERNDLPARVQLYAMRTDMKMKVFEWQKAVWTVPHALGRSTRLGALVFDELRRAEEVARYLRASIRALARAEGRGNGEVLATMANRCERAYWQTLEGGFASLLQRIAALNPDAPDDPELVAEATAEWRDLITDAAIEQFEFAAKDMDSDGDALERLVTARGRLMANLRRAMS